GADLKMQVRSGGSARGTHITDMGSRGDGLPGGDVDAVCPHVRICRAERLATYGVFDDDQPAVAAGELGDEHVAVGYCVDRGAIGGPVVRTGVEGAFPGERV